MSFVKGAVGIVCGIGIMLFGALMLSVAGYGSMKPIYEGVLWLGVLIFVLSPIIYWGGGIVRWVQENA